MAEETVRRGFRRWRGPVVAWIACAAWAAYWIHDEAGKPPPEPWPAWLAEPIPWAAWEMPVLFAGALVLLWFVAGAILGRVRTRMRPSRRHRGEFAEAAGAWLLLDLAVYAAAARGFGESWGLFEWAMVPLVVVGIGLAWPVFLGVDGRRSQAALGLTRGRGVAVETAIGLLAVPAVLAIQGCWTLLVSPHLGRPNPIDDWLYSGDPSLRSYAIFACVVQAPLFEECGFRGLLHRFLRDSARRLSGPVAACAAALVSSAVFAIAHPYGWIGLVPILLFGLAAAVLREWRGSLVAPIALHAG
ncbi:MAG TPA: type II CAAX endopeptidase family protein, partial [Planctomycetota bacterium]|nr:type II CAAX endopeptidase family protein [Planctomycetota bacterium]